MNNKKVLVAMSGGVDSSVSAFLLKEMGYEIYGVSFITKYFNQQSVKDAQTVANSLNIPLTVLDLTKDFENTVIKYFSDTYFEGKTPNPCVFCNPIIKWGKLLELADNLSINFLATGHYAKIDFNSLTKRYSLKNVNHKKDQSYFLWKLSQEQLARTIFPLSEIDKNRVREIAVSIGLNVSDKPDSQEICFINDDYRIFLENNFSDRIKSIGQGDYIYNDKAVGKHKGYPFYTIGQRKRLGIALGKPAYVTSINPDKNEVYLSTENSPDSAIVKATKINLMGWDSVKLNEIVFGKIRFNNPAEAAKIISFENGTLTIEFEKSKNAVAPGQSLVLYDENGLILLGGEIE